LISFLTESDKLDNLLSKLFSRVDIFLLREDLIEDTLDSRVESLEYIGFIWSYRLEDVICRRCISSE